MRSGGDPTHGICSRRGPSRELSSNAVAQRGRSTARGSGGRGRPATEQLALSISRFSGYKAVGTPTDAWPDADKKAQRPDGVLRQRPGDLGLEFAAVLADFVGADATPG